MTFRIVTIRAAHNVSEQSLYAASIYHGILYYRPFLQLPENKLMQEQMLFISLLKARIGAQMEGGGGTRVIGMTSSKGSIWSISVWMTQVANVSLYLG